MPRYAIEHQPAYAAAALGAFHTTALAAASPRALPAPPSAPAVISSEAAPALPALPDRLDLLAALRTFTPTPERLLMGQGASGPVYRSLEQLLHVGVLGSSGSGKSTSQLALACQLAMIDGATMAVLDPEAATFQALRTSPRLYLPFPEDGAACVDNLQALQGELNERRALLSHAGAWDWQELNREHGGMMAPIFGFIDELPTLTSYQDTEPLLLDLARRGRKCGMYLMVASQSLKREDVGSTTIRQQFATKLLLRTGEAAQGRALGLEANWCKQATAFNEPGLAVYSPSDGQPEVIRVPYVGKAAAAHILRGATVPTPAVARPVTSGRMLASEPEPEPRELLNQQFTVCESHEPEFKHVANVPEIAGIVQRLKAEGRGKNAIIETVWGAKPGGTRAYREASEQYRQLVEGTS